MKDRTDLPERKCEYCGVLYMPKRLAQKYCGLKCSRDDMKRKDGLHFALIRSKRKT